MESGGCGGVVGGGQGEGEKEKETEEVEAEGEVNEEAKAEGKSKEAGKDWEEVTEEGFQLGIVECLTVTVQFDRRESNWPAQQPSVLLIA
ncbi:hypothetical protein B296_00029140 [Ensete ventricosum]|uniref:Uncharacterized protein n=1 Tax=Ensete ventricosum TaxID=4639 RepID=A0A427AC48_ENSVE|nr:hypothetical protein B296_00029140 [Ensete ventricosum]